MKITIEVEDLQKFETLVEWLRTNKFIDEISVNKAESAITKGDKSVDPTSLFGIWKDSPRTMDEIRGDAWRDKL